MSHEKKQEVILFLREKDSMPPYEQFNKAFNFYRNHPRKSRSLELSYNRLGYSEQSLKNIIYDLHKMFDISEVEVQNASLVSMVEEENDIKKLFIIAFGALSDAVKELAFQLFKVAQTYGEEILTVPSIEDYFEKTNQELVSLISSNDLFLEMNDSALDSLTNHFKNEIENIEISEEVRVLIDAITPGTPVVAINAKKQFLNELSEKAAAVISSVTGENFEGIKVEDFQNVREEFPFLNEDNCPDVMLIVVGKRITAFKKYQALHAKLQEVNEGKHPETTEEEKLQLAKDAEAAFAENRLCWEELKHYDTNKTFLGKHPVFYESNIKNEVDLMTNEELIKFKSSSVKYFSTNKKDLITFAGNTEKVEAINKRIADREFKLSLVNAKLGVSQDVKK
ncbi:hypothetical protein [Flavobacterium sp.]|uniref:hypothetical protein n=1 Tax=Flavobacterium sp. TaxID=239 RepID=UPI0026332E47|nr:hypothetical protein [Flavobacterium sp.]